MTFQWKSDAIFNILEDLKRTEKSHAMNQSYRKFDKNLEKIIRNYNAWNQNLKYKCKKAERDN